MALIGQVLTSLETCVCLYIKHDTINRNYDIFFPVGNVQSYIKDYKRWRTCHISGETAQCSLIILLSLLFFIFHSHLTPCLAVPTSMSFISLQHKKKGIWTLSFYSVYLQQPYCPLGVFTLKGFADRALVMKPSTENTAHPNTVCSVTS